MKHIKVWATSKLGESWARDHKASISNLPHAVNLTKETLLDIAPVEFGIARGLLVITSKRLIGISVGFDIPLKAISGLAAQAGTGGSSNNFQLKVSTPGEHLPLQVPIEFRDRILESLRSVLPNQDAGAMRTAAESYTAAQAKKKMAKQAESDAKLADDAKRWALGALLASIAAYLLWYYIWPPVVAALVTGVAWTVANDNKDSKGNVIAAGRGMRGTAIAISAINCFLVAVNQGWIS